MLLEAVVICAVGKKWSEAVGVGAKFALGALEVSFVTQVLLITRLMIFPPRYLRHARQRPPGAPPLFEPSGIPTGPRGPTVLFGANHVDGAEAKA